MLIRNYQPGDEADQAAIYNAAAGALPAFKPATAAEIARRYRTTDPDPGTKFYAVADGRVVGYATFSPTGRISFPWCLPGAESAQPALLDAVLDALRLREARAAWAAYRSDWEPVHDRLHLYGFTHLRDMINYVAELGRLPRTQLPQDRDIGPLERLELTGALRMASNVLPGEPIAEPDRFFWESPYLAPEGLLAIRERGTGRLLGAAVIVINPGYADPTQINAAMPCFRLGTWGTETQRHKRVNGLVSCVFNDDQTGEWLLSEAARRLETAGLTHAAAQAASDDEKTRALYGHFMAQQGSFPMLARALEPARAGNVGVEASAPHDPGPPPSARKSGSAG